eukprot:6752847-Pyramimonas_sp.AAC.2
MGHPCADNSKGGHTRSGTHYLCIPLNSSMSAIYLYIPGRASYQGTYPIPISLVVSAASAASVEKFPLQCASSGIAVSMACTPVAHRSGSDRWRRVPRTRPWKGRRRARAR